MTEQQEAQVAQDRSAESPVARNLVTFLAISAIVFAVWLVVRVKTVVVVLLISVVFATGLAPAVTWVENINLPRGKHIPRPLAIMLVYIAALALGLAAAAVIVVPLVREIVEFAREFPVYLDWAREWLEGMHARYPAIPDYAGLLTAMQSQFENVGRHIMAGAKPAFGFLGGIVSGVSALVITFYLLATYEGIRKSFLAIVPTRHERLAKRTLKKMSGAMGGWLRGQLLLAGIIGLSTTGAMTLIGVPYAAVIGVVAAVGELVPMVGPFAGAVPAILIALFGPTWKLAAAVVFFALLSQAENTYLAPRIMQKHVGLSPLVTIVALMIGATLLGIVGALLAIPLAAGLRVVYIEVVAPAIKQWAGRNTKRKARA